MPDPTDRSPSLSGRADLTGREPMIRGVIEKAQADMRGAYLAGNLIGLIDLMDEEQQHAFKCWNVQIALRKAKSVLYLYERERPGGTLPRRRLALLEQWLNAPEDIEVSHIRRLIDAGWTTDDREAARLTVVASAANSAALDGVRCLDERSPQIYVAAMRHTVISTFEAQGVLNRLVAHYDILAQHAAKLNLIFKLTAASFRAQLRAAYIILGANPFVVGGERRWR